MSSLLGLPQAPLAEESPVTAIDIALEPDSAMVQHATAANALLSAYPRGFALDETHHPHTTMLQQFVRTDALDKVFAAANAVLAKEKPANWSLRAIKYYYIPLPPLGVAGIVVEPTEDLHRLQDELIAAVAPYAAKTGTLAAFFSDEGGRLGRGITQRRLRRRVSGRRGSARSEPVSSLQGTNRHLGSARMRP